LTQKWQEEREELQKEKQAKARLEEARRELQQAQRRGDWTRASELAYGTIPELEKFLKSRKHVFLSLSLSLFIYTIQQNHFFNTYFHYNFL
jgi:hypothetical protein